MLFQVICLLFLLGVSSQYEIDDKVYVGRRFDGLGGISGGGATSKLLSTYAPDIRNDILDVLFTPNFGASIHILKVEIGGDAQSTEGTESSHMHTPYDESYVRGYEWDIMIEAKKRNPNITLVGLPWTFPGWLSNNTQNPFFNSSATANYVVKWVQGAQKFHNLTIDYLGLWNEPPSNPKIYEYAIVLRNALNKANLSYVKLISGDATNWDSAKLIIADKDLSDAIDVIGAHYPGTVSTKVAQLSKKVLWASEDYSTVDNSVGAGCLARLINRNYVNGHMTSTIAWNMLASYYDTLPYPNCGLFTANQPWSGHYTINAPVWIMAHTTQFAKPGWHYLARNHGVGYLKQGGTYVSFTDPKRKELTIVIETMSYNKSICIRPKIPEYNVTTQDIYFKLGGSFKAIKKMPIWVSRLHRPNPDLMIQEGVIEPVDGQIYLRGVEPDMVVTITTVTIGKKGQPKAPIPASKPFPRMYTEDFENYKIGAEPNYLTPQIGSFEVVKEDDGSHVMAQTVRNPAVEFCGPHVGLYFPASPITVMPLASYENGFNVSVKMLINLSKISKPDGLFMALFLQGGGCHMANFPGLFINFNLTSSGGVCAVYNKFNFSAGTESHKIACHINNNQWINVQVKVLPGSVSLHLNGEQIYSSIPYKGKQDGFFALGCTNYHDCRYDDLMIQPST